MNELVMKMEKQEIKETKKINFGYACINTELKKKGIFTSRTCRIATIEKKGESYLLQLARENLKDLKEIIKWNIQNDILFYRMSSDIFPFASHEKYCYSLDQFEKELAEIGYMARESKMRLTFHPGQYTVLSTDKDNVLKNSIREIEMHNTILQKMGMGCDSILVLHVGSKVGGKKASLKRFVEGFNLLSEGARKRIVLENCETGYKIEELLEVSNETGIPIVIDYHHHSLHKGDVDLYYLIDQVLSVWKKRGIKPKFHLSESRDPLGNFTQKRAHSDLILDSLEILSKHPEGVDLMIEAKLKEQAIFYIRNK